jgi:hypothetical protein
VTVAVAFTPATPHNGDGVAITVSEDTAAGLEGPATCKITRDSDSEVVGRSTPFGISEQFGFSDATATLTLTADGGTYKLTVDGHQTAAIAWNANAAAIEAAISLAAGSAVVHVTGTGPFTLASEGLDLNKAETVTADATSLTLTASTATAVIAPVVVGGTGNFTDTAGPFTFGPTVLATGNYHIDVVDASEASLLPGGTPVALVVAA